MGLIFNQAKSKKPFQCLVTMVIWLKKKLVSRAKTTA